MNLSISSLFQLSKENTVTDIVKYAFFLKKLYVEMFYLDESEV